MVALSAQAFARVTPLGADILIQLGQTPGPLNDPPYREVADSWPLTSDTGFPRPRKRRERRYTRTGREENPMERIILYHNPG